MLGSLKKKFSSALQEGLIISESLQQQVRQRVSSVSSTTPTTPTTPTTFDANTQSPRGSRTSLNTNELGIPADLNMAAGCNLLAKYEDDWQGISQTNEQNANKAAQIAKQIEQIDQRVTKQKVTVDDLLNSLQSLPQLVQKVEESKQTLQQLTALSATVEAELLELQDLCEECALQEFMLEKEFEYSQATQRKMVELERYRQQVALEHELKLQKHEEHLRKIQKERQAVFDDAFRGDLEEFKQKGTLSRIDKDGQKSLALEEVVLEDAGVTSDALEEFLNG